MASPFKHSPFKKSSKAGVGAKFDLQMTSTINERLIDQQNPMHGGVVADFGDSASNSTPSAAPSPAPSRMNSRSPSKQGYERANSVPRSGFSRTWTDTLAFPRSMTMNSILDFESEEAILRKLIDEYNVVNKKGPEGDVPIPAGFADKLTFWYIVGVTLLFGGFMGLGKNSFLFILGLFMRFIYHRLKPSRAHSFLLFLVLNE